MVKSQFLIGKVVQLTTQTKDGQWLNTNMSQFLIGKVLLTSDVAQIIKGVNPLKSQFLIGKVEHFISRRKPT